MTRDPLGYEGSPRNLSCYVSNNPVANVDPSGLLPKIPIWSCKWDPPGPVIHIGMPPDATLGLGTCTYYDIAKQKGKCCILGIPLPVKVTRLVKIGEPVICVMPKGGCPGPYPATYNLNVGIIANSGVCPPVPKP